MALSGCASGVLLTAAVALLLLPAQYYVPELYAPEVPPAPEPPPPAGWRDLAFSHLPPLDLFFTVTLIMTACFTYICEWIQRKLMERRIVKLNQYLGASVERLRSWDAQQEQLQATLRMVQNATCEYNLLLCLLLRRRGPAPARPPAACRDKDAFEDIPPLRGSVDAPV